MASTSALRMDGEVIGCFGEIAGFDINAKFFAQLLCGRSALRTSLIVRTPWSVKFRAACTRTWRFSFDKESQITIHVGTAAASVSRYRWAHELHRVVNRKPRGHHAPRRVDVHADLFLRVVSLKKEQLRHHQARDRVVDRARDEEERSLSSRE